MKEIILTIFAGVVTGLTLFTFLEPVIRISLRKPPEEKKYIIHDKKESSEE